MACFLSIEEVAIDLECFGCTRPAGDAPLVAWADVLRPGKLEPVCLYCLRSLDPTLARFYDLAVDLVAAARVRLHDGTPGVTRDLDGGPADPVAARHAAREP